MTREAALAEIANIEREIARLQAQNIPATEQQVASLSRLPMTGGAFIPPTRQTIGEESMAEAEAIQREKMSDLGKASLRYGVPLAVGIATGGASIPIQIAAGSTSAALGETGAQTFEEGDYRKGDIAGAFVRGAAPVF